MLREIFQRIFGSSKSAASSTPQETEIIDPSMNYLIVGLGNIGEKYDQTRHNVGFEIADALAEEFEAQFSMERHAFKSHFRWKSRNIYLIKPTTFMNLSGKAVRYWMGQHKVPLENVLILVDDLALPFGKLRVRAKGSDGGHNGLKDINQALGHNKYARLRFGIGDSFSKGRQVDYVLGKWSKKEQEDLASYVHEAVGMAKEFIAVGLNPGKGK